MTSNSTMTTTQSLVHTAMVCNQQAITHAADGNIGHAVALFSRGLTLLSQHQLSTAAPDDVNSASTNALSARMATPTSFAFTSIDIGVNPHQQAVSAEVDELTYDAASMPPFFTRAFALQDFVQQLSKLYADGDDNTLVMITTAYTFYNAALTYHIAAMASATNSTAHLVEQQSHLVHHDSRLLQRALHLYNKCWSYLNIQNKNNNDNTVSLLIPLLPLRLALCTNMAHIFTTTYDRPRAEAVRQVFRALLQQASLTSQYHNNTAGILAYFSCRKEYIYFAMQKWQLEFPVLCIAAAA